VAFQKVFGDDQAKFEEQEKVIDALPLVKLKMEAYTAGEDDICVGDMLTCKLRVDYRNLKKKQQSGYVHSRHYPYLRRDTWYLIVTDNNFMGLAAVEKLNVEEDFFEKEYKERVVRPGPIDFTVILVNDSYKGLDQYEKHSVMIVQESQNRREIKYRKADLRAIKDTAIFFKKDPDELESTDDEQDSADKKDDEPQRLVELKLENDFMELYEKLDKLEMKDSMEQLAKMGPAYFRGKQVIHGLPPPLYSNRGVPKTPFLPPAGKMLYQNQKAFEMQQKILQERRIQQIEA
jgi:hypothetical protein